MTTPDYNPVAWCYDGLAGLVFGHSLTEARKVYLGKITANSHLLIVGGGSGLLLNYLEERQQPLTVAFVDPSARMIEKARKRRLKYLQVQFYRQPVQEFPGGDFDFIITNFFFDQFIPGEAGRLMAVVKAKLRPEGKLLFSDFIVVPGWRARLQTWLMYRFFRLTTGLKATSYPDYDRLFQQTGLVKEASSMVGQGIMAACYRHRVPIK